MRSGRGFAPGRRPGGDITPRPAALREEPAAAALAGVAARLDGRAGGGRRFAIRFWDGSELPPPGGEPEAVLVVRSPRALAYVLREPNELGLGRAWVAGDLDLEGDLEGE